MEVAVIHSDLKKQEIQPQKLLYKYLSLLETDIKKLLPLESLKNFSCPLTGNLGETESFFKMGLQYKISQNYGNIFLSPRPNEEQIKKFYKESSARKFWLEEIWSKTAEVRNKKIVMPQLKWVQDFFSQYFTKNNLRIAEFLPSNWSYYQVAKNIWPEVEYNLFDILFDLEIAKVNIYIPGEDNKNNSNVFDSIFLFEAIDRAVDPEKVLRKANQSLKPGGLCFITCLLSSGFEVKILGKESEIFAPPERMNLFSYEGIKTLIEKVKDFDILEFSTPGVLDIPNVSSKLEKIDNVNFFKYILKHRNNEDLLKSFQEFIQLNRLGTFGRLVLRKL